MQQTQRKRMWRLVFSAYLLIILLSLLTVASYTWFSLSTTPRVSDMYMFVNTQTGLELSVDPLAEEWELQLDFRDIVDETAPLRPVTWSEQDQTFYAANYGPDGRQIDQWTALSDVFNANSDSYLGYYTKITFFARSDVAVDVSLSPAVEVDQGISGSGTYVIGTPVWNEQEILHENGGQGAECAIRVGFRITPVVDGQPTEEESAFLIYEPNSDAHPDGSRGYVDTPSIDGTATLISTDRLITQTASTWEETYPVEHNVVIRDLGEFIGSTDLFSLKAGEMVRIDIYIWLEGQDVDCTNEIEAAQIIANIQFAVEEDTGSGLVPIE